MMFSITLNITSREAKILKHVLHIAQVIDYDPLPIERGTKEADNEEIQYTIHAIELQLQQLLKKL